MNIVSRGFSGRRRTADAQLPPGQYLVEDFPVLSAGPTPRIDLDTWELRVVDESGQAQTWDWNTFRSLPSEDVTTDLHCVTKWSKLGTHWTGVSIDTLLDRHRHGRRLRRRELLRRLHDEPAARGPARRSGLGRVCVRRRTARGGARWPGPAAGAPPVPVEVREVAAGAAAAHRRRARLLGDPRLPQLRRPMARAAVLGRLRWQVATVTDVRDEGPIARTLGLTVPAVARA